MLTRFLIAGTLAGGFVLIVLNWVTAAILPPRHRQFKDPAAVVKALRGNVPENDIYTAPQGLFRGRVTWATAALWYRRPACYRVRGGFGLVVARACYASPFVNTYCGFLWAGRTDCRTRDWNWAGFPTSYLLAGSGYLAANWFITGLVFGALR